MMSKNDVLFSGFKFCDGEEVGFKILQEVPSDATEQDIFECILWHIVNSEKGDKPYCTSYPLLTGDMEDALWEARRLMEGKSSEGLPISRPRPAFKYYLKKNNYVWYNVKVRNYEQYENEERAYDPSEDAYDAEADEEFRRWEEEMQGSAY